LTMLENYHAGVEDIFTVNASEKVIRFSRFRPEPGIQSRAPVGGDAVGTLQQFLN
jgi:hypothetical protein